MKKYLCCPKCKRMFNDFFTWGCFRYCYPCLGPEQLITIASTLVRMTIKTDIISINPMTDDIDILKNNRSIVKENILEIHSKIFDQIYDETCELAIKSYVNAKKKHESDQD